MGIRHWLRKRLAEGDTGEDVPPGQSIFAAIFGREAETPRSLGEFDCDSYPEELRQVLCRREEVAAELREMDLTTRQARIDAIPRLREMLRTYPHPLAYETLIQAYVDAGRWDEARGAAFAARERRSQVARSPYSEIRSETDRLTGWSPEEIEELRREREGEAAGTGG
jgi:hypothetical protein